MKAHLINTHLLVPRSRSSAKVKVKYQGLVSQKIGVLGGISLSQTHLVFNLCYFLKTLKEKSSENFVGKGELVVSVNFENIAEKMNNSCMFKIISAVCPACLL